MVCKLRPRSRLDHPSPARHRNGTHTTLTQSPNYLWYRVAVCPANMINPLKLRSSNQPTSHSYFNLFGRRIASWCLKIRSDAIAVMRQGSVWAAWRGAQHPQDHLEVSQQPKCLKPAVSRCVQLNFAKLKQLATPEGQNCLEIESSSRSALLFHAIRWGLLRKSNCLKQLIWTNLQNICSLSVGNSSNNKPTWYQAW